MKEEKGEGKNGERTDFHRRLKQGYYTKNHNQRVANYYASNKNND